jgi:hypothetical protein
MDCIKIKELNNYACYSPVSTNSSTIAFPIAKELHDKNCLESMKMYFQYCNNENIIEKKIKNKVHDEID